MTPTAARRATIAHLRALVDQPHTSGPERAAALRMLDHVRAEPTAPSGRARVPGWGDGCRSGERYEQTRHLELPDVTRLMRADVDLVRSLGARMEPGALAFMDALGALPATAEVSVRGRLSRGGHRAIEIRVREIQRAWGFARETDECGVTRWVPSPALCAVVHDLAALHWLYNHDASDRRGGHVDRRYLGGVAHEWPQGEAP